MRDIRLTTLASAKKYTAKIGSSGISNVQTQPRVLQVFKHFGSMLSKRESVAMATKQREDRAASL